jgi:transcriptional regulator with XRE-family HTH domain
MTPEALRLWRTGRGLTQAQLAELAGVSVRQIKRWEAGAHPVPKLLELYAKEHTANAC